MPVDGLAELLGEAAGEALVVAGTTNDNNPKKKGRCLLVALAFVAATVGIVAYCGSGPDEATPADANKVPPTEEPCPPEASVKPRTEKLVFNA